ncbi:unnamed protein product, partial [Cylicocyclus nassatus]
VLSLLVVSVFHLCSCLPFTKKTPFAPFVFVIMNFILSCTHPWTYFLFNSEVRSKVLQVARCQLNAQVGCRRRDSLSFCANRTRSGYPHSDHTCTVKASNVMQVISHFHAHDKHCI